MKLELKHLSPYLPYKLRVDLSALEHFNLDNKCDIIVYIDEFMYGYTKNKKVGFSSFRYSFVNFNICKPILRPLSDMNDNEMNTIRSMAFNNCDKWRKEHWSFIKNVKSFPAEQKYKITMYLIECGYDVFGLIEQDLAIDINTLK